jgi:hypothetical protein
MDTNSKSKWDFDLKYFPELYERAWSFILDMRPGIGIYQNNISDSFFTYLTGGNAIYNYIVQPYEDDLELCVAHFFDRQHGPHSWTVCWEIVNPDIERLVTIHAGMDIAAEGYRRFTYRVEMFHMTVQGTWRSMDNRKFVKDFSTSTALTDLEKHIYVLTESAHEWLKLE